VSARAWLAVLAGPAVALAVAGCSGPGAGFGIKVIEPSAPRAEAAAWMAEHPAREVPGLVNAMILPGGYAVFGFAGQAGGQACPGWPEEFGGVPQPTASPTASPGAYTDAYLSGSLPGCGAWTATALTVTGEVVTLACGSIPARVECPLWRYANGYVPSGGDYVRIRPGGGPIAGWPDLQVIELFADLSPLLQESGTGTGWITSPARVTAPGPCGPGLAPAPGTPDCPGTPAPSLAGTFPARGA
jgi:hypothetical protein